MGASDSRNVRTALGPLAAGCGAVAVQTGTTKETTKIADKTTTLTPSYVLTRKSAENGFIAEIILGVGPNATPDPAGTGATPDTGGETS